MPTVKRILALALVVSAAATPTVPRQRRTAVAVPEEVTVRGDTLSLADLLPLEAPDQARAAAAKVAFGYAPRPGVARVLTRAQIEYRLRHAPDVLRALGLPERVVVRRAYRALSREEIFAAIEIALAADGRCQQGSCPDLRPENLQLEAAIPVTREDPGLRLTRMEFGEPRAGTRFRLWASREPRSPPFTVTLKSGALGEPPAGPRTRQQTHVAHRGPRAGTEKLVEPGKTATLMVEGRGVRIASPVIPLERGGRGARIRVRSVATKKVFLAEVVGPNQLRLAI